eukprot:SAG11_NODE_192_length_12931_cov_5.747682_14_plen_179_part_00
MDPLTLLPATVSIRPHRSLALQLCGLINSDGSDRVSALWTALGAQHTEWVQEGILSDAVRLEPQFFLMIVMEYCPEGDLGQRIALAFDRVLSDGTAWPMGIAGPRGDTLFSFQPRSHPLLPKTRVSTHADTSAHTGAGGPPRTLCADDDEVEDDDLLPLPEAPERHEPAIAETQVCMP